jgi:hypothetical protein
MSDRKRGRPEEKKDGEEEKDKNNGKQEKKEEVAVVEPVRSSKRLKQQIVYDPPQWKKWFDNFETGSTPKEDSDGQQSCRVKLYYSDTKFFEGKTGQGKGHAEMDALDKFISHMNSQKTGLADYTLRIRCEDKPCCVQCSAIMGALNIKPFSVLGTKKTHEVMKAGGTWGVSNNTKDFLSTHLNISKTEIDNFSNSASQDIIRIMG